MANGMYTLQNCRIYRSAFSYSWIRTY